jgi:hypothetical protein
VLKWPRDSGARIPMLIDCSDGKSTDAHISMQQVQAFA